LNCGPYEGLGNNPKYPGWYGGKVQFQGKLKALEGPSNEYRITLDTCSIGPSSRFTRRFGSWSFLRVKVPKKVFFAGNENLIAYLKRPFVIWGQIYRACYAKDQNVFFYQTNELFPTGLDPGRLSLLDFLDWHNPLEPNSDQVMTLRIALMKNQS